MNAHALAASVDWMTRAEHESFLTWCRPGAPVVPPAPPRGKDYPSVVTVVGRRGDFADAEVAALAGFARLVTSAHDGGRPGGRGFANTYLFTREDGPGVRFERVAWRDGGRAFRDVDSCMEHAVGYLPDEPDPEALARLDAERGVAAPAAAATP